MILVTGATGSVGSHVVSQLLDAGAPVRALTRGGAVPGAESAVGDLSAPETLDACLDGIDGVFLIWPLFTADAAPRVVEALAKRVRRVVYLSTIAVRDDLEVQTHPYSVFHSELERLLAASGTGWTVLRAAKFARNALGWAEEVRADGIVRFPYGNAARSPIDERDIAAVAASVLTVEGHEGRRYVVTGPESLTEAEQVRVIGETAGRPARHEEMAPDAWRKQAVAAGSSPELADAALEYWAQLVTQPEPVTSTVEDLTGSPARTFREWVSDNADDFR